MAIIYMLACLVYPTNLLTSIHFYFIFFLSAPCTYCLIFNYPIFKFTNSFSVWFNLLLKFFQ
jgi:hypothetical protein